VKTLDDHNTERKALWDRIKEAAAAEIKAGVTCPQCAAAGHTVEMQKDTVRRSSLGRQAVICPECGTSGEML
jgi:rubredoxin